MKIVVGCDHRGFRRKEGLIHLLRRMGYGIVDKGCHDSQPADYPDIAFSVAQAVAKQEASRGVLICGSGIGMGMAANKVAGIRAAVAWNEKTARLSTEHNHANVLCLSADLTSSAILNRMVKAWLKATPQGGRHLRRVKKIAALDR